MATEPTNDRSCSMQITRTDVHDVIGRAGQPVLRVLFCGEGGECVSVDLTKPQTVENEEATIERARAMLVQTASFGLAANDYDAESSGNFDEVAVTAVNDQSGATYIFEYRDGDGARRVPASSMPSFEAARQEAIRCAIDVLVDLQPGTDDLSGWLVRVLDENGALLCSIDVSEADAARQADAATL